MRLRWNQWDNSNMCRVRPNLESTSTSAPRLIPTGGQDRGTAYLRHAGNYYYHPSDSLVCKVSFRRKSPHPLRDLTSRRERQCCRAAEERDEFPSPQSMTSSARASSVGGTSRPSAFAVLRLTTSSNLVGCWTGRVPGVSLSERRRRLRPPRRGGEARQSQWGSRPSGKTGGQ